jgi:GMP synthase (glutamine-hydrolysing)
MTRALILLHVACEGPGLIGEIFRERGIETDLIRLYEGGLVPHDLGATSGLVVMGGPMGVYETNQYPHLRDELKLIESAVRQNRPVLGVCLGSQLLAAALGARVYPGKQKEIGWYAVELQDGARQDPLWRDQPRSFMPLHWHGDIFELPKGAVSLAASALTQHQAFRYGDRSYGLLFHLEVTPQQLRGMVQTFQDELAGAAIAPESILHDAEERCRQAEEVGRQVFGKFAALVCDLRL